MTTSPSSAPALLDARQLASHLNVTVGFIHRKTSEGRIPRRKFGHRTVRYILDEVLDALAREDEPPRPPPPPRRGGSGTPSAPPTVNDLPPYSWSSDRDSSGPTIPPDRSSKGGS